ncbi:MAG: hypothetical protein DMG32_18780 [Acidobacteria bacterium]|nr:MAG: hypothetical protein DMG32_18780 [Acidobacteriota bacterium]
MNPTRSRILDHIERFGGGASGEVERIRGCAAQRVFPPAQPPGAAAAYRTAGFLQCGAAFAEVPEKTWCEHDGLLNVRFHIIFLRNMAGVRANRISWLRKMEPQCALSSREGTAEPLVAG